MPWPKKRKQTEETAVASINDADNPSEAKRRRSERVSSSGKKSRYFQDEESAKDQEDETDSEPVLTPSAKSKSRRKSAGSAGRPKKKAKVEGEDENDDEDEPVQEVTSKATKAKGKGKTKPQTPKTKSKSKSKPVKNEAEDDEEEESELDEDAPPKVTFIPLPKLRDEGGVAYADDRVHPNTLAFLKDLKAHNQRDWLKLHDKEYRRSLKDWESYVETMTEKVIAADETIPELPFKDVNFRIYRDIRFSNDPTPYKPHYSAAWSRTGRKGPYACYYVHVEPGKCFVGGGLWHPDGEAVQKLRASIDERPRRWRRVLMDPKFRETFLPGASASKVKGKAKAKAPAKQKATSASTPAKGKGRGRGRPAKNAKAEAEPEAEEEEEEPVLDDQQLEENSVLLAFAESNKENALKTKPKGFTTEHRDIELLKLRNFTVGKKLPDSVFTSPDGQDQVAEIIEAMVGFITHLNRIVMPDPDDDDEESDEE